MWFPIGDVIGEGFNCKGGQSFELLPIVILFLLFYMMTVLYIYMMTVSLHYISRLRANAHSF